MMDPLCPGLPVPSSILNFLGESDGEAVARVLDDTVDSEDEGIIRNPGSRWHLHKNSAIYDHMIRMHKSTPKKTRKTDANPVSSEGLDLSDNASWDDQLLKLRKKYSLVQAKDIRDSPSSFKELLNRSPKDLEAYQILCPKDFDPKCLAGLTLKDIINDDAIPWKKQLTCSSTPYEAYFDSSREGETLHIVMPKSGGNSTARYKLSNYKSRGIVVIIPDTDNGPRGVKEAGTNLEGNRNKRRRKKRKRNLSKEDYSTSE